MSVVVPSAEPVGDPSAPGTVRVQLPWLPLSILVVLLGAAAAAAGRWIRMAQPLAKGPRLMQGLSAGTHDPPKAPSGNLPPELPVMATLTESDVAPAAGDPLLTHEAAHTGQAGDERITIHGSQHAPPHDGPPRTQVNEINVTKPADSVSGGEKDVQIKGSTIKEN